MIKPSVMVRIFLISMISVILYSCSSERNDETIPHSLKEDPGAAEPIKEVTDQTYKFKKDSTAYQSLMEAGVKGTTVHKLVKASKQYMDLSRVQAGSRYTIQRDSENNILSITFHMSNIRRLEMLHEGDEWKPRMHVIPTQIQLLSFSGDVSDSLWNSGIKASVPPYLITALAEVFSWEIDFYREIRKGDRWKFTAEQLLANGAHVGWGNIVHAEYVNAGKSHKAYYFQARDYDIIGHYNETGKSLRKMFLRSPLKFGRVTSHFSRRRFHPIKKVYRPHNGVDYGAPTGTPIRTIGTGRITKIGRYGGAGKLITIRHPGNYKSRYLHMSKFRPGLKKGSRVQQGDIIGYVGRTGSATGPHLHFELWKNGSYRDPLKVRLPASKSIPEGLLPAYKEHVKKVDSQFSKIQAH